MRSHSALPIVRLARPDLSDANYRETRFKVCLTNTSDESILCRLSNWTRMNLEHPQRSTSFYFFAIFSEIEHIYVRAKMSSMKKYDKYNFKYTCVYSAE